MDRCIPRSSRHRGLAPTAGTKSNNRGTHGTLGESGVLEQPCKVDLMQRGVSGALSTDQDLDGARHSSPRSCTPQYDMKLELTEIAHDLSVSMYRLRYRSARSRGSGRAIGATSL